MNEMKELDAVADAKVSTTMGIAALALQMAMQYHKATVVSDGALYQQYKLEGRNMRDLSIDVVFETAIQVERHLLSREKAIAEMISNAIIEGFASEEADEASQGEEQQTEENRT